MNMYAWGPFEFISVSNTVETDHNACMYMYLISRLNPSQCTCMYIHVYLHVRTCIYYEGFSLGIGTWISFGSLSQILYLSVINGSGYVTCSCTLYMCSHFRCLLCINYS